MTIDDELPSQGRTRPRRNILTQPGQRSNQDPMAPGHQASSRLAEAEARLESMTLRAKAAERQVSLCEAKSHQSLQQLEAIVLESRYEAARLVRAQRSRIPDPANVGLPGLRGPRNGRHDGRLRTAVQAALFVIGLVIWVELVRDAARGFIIAARSDGRAIWRRNFDAHYYAAVNPDVMAAGINGALHYLLIGFREGREPSLTFSGQTYLRVNPDAAGWNPLVHYARHGHREGRPFPSIERKQGLSSRARHLNRSTTEVWPRS